MTGTDAVTAHKQSCQHQPALQLAVRWVLTQLTGLTGLTSLRRLDQPE